jgi:hypothetical protein
MPRAAGPPELVDVTVGPRIVHMLRPYGIESIASRRADNKCSAGGGGQVGMMPRAAGPPELVDVAVGSRIVHVLRRLRIEHITGRRATRYWCAGCGGQVGMMPPAAIPPELVDVTVRPKVVHVLGPLRIEHITGRRVTSYAARCGGCGGQVGMMPPAASPLELVDVAVGPLVDDMQAATKFVTRRATVR